MKQRFKGVYRYQLSPITVWARRQEMKGYLTHGRLKSKEIVFIERMRFIIV